MHDWFDVLPGGHRETHAALLHVIESQSQTEHAATQNHNKKKKVKNNKHVKFKNQSKKKTVATNKNNKQHNKKKAQRKKSHTPARFYFDQPKLPKPQLSSYLFGNSDNQPTMHNFTSSPNTKFSPVFGDDITEKEDGICRIVSQNVGCLGISSFSNNKMRTAKEWLIRHQVDICGWQEIGFANHLLPRHERMAERMRDSRWKSVRTSTSSNTHEDVDRFQWGGTSTIAFNLFAHMTHSSGVDTTGLGRWSWILLEGHYGIRVRIITAYNPCKTRSTQLSTVYAQHRRYFLTQKVDTCPRLMFRRDLCAFIQKCHSDSELIVLLIDCNENLEKLQDLHKHLISDPISLIDPIRFRHFNGRALPPTNEKGSYPIDAIFVSSSLWHITRGGWLRFGEGVGDHRPLFIDINIKKLIGRFKNITYPHRVRRLQCNDPRTVKKFNCLLEQQYHAHNTKQKLKEFHELRSDPITSDDFDRLCRIDKVSTSAVRYAEKRCRKLRMGAKPYTPKLNKLGQTINAWHLVIKKKHGKKISSSLLRRISRRCNLPNTKNLCVNDCIKLRAQAFREYNDYAKDADMHRDDMYELLAEAQAEAGNITKSNALKQQRLNEESRVTHQRIKLVTKDIMGAPYQMEITHENRTFLSADRTQLEAALMQENEHKYRLAYSSPFLQEPLLTEFGKMALNDNSQAVLDGTYVCPPNTSKYTKKFIEALQMDDCVRKQGINPVRISTSQSNAFWNKMTERTSSSPSMKHIGTYKAATKNKINARIQAQLTSIPYEIGRPLPRSKQCINVSLEKKGKGRTPSDMRTIWLIEADFNAGAKVHFVRRMINNTALGHNLVPESQYAKQQSRSIEAATIKVIFFDILRQTRSPGVFFASDLHQCFDRMAHPVCSLVMQRLGVDKNVIKCMLTAIQEMTHVVRTGYGDSTASYGNYHDSPLQGGGQGNAVAGPLFIAISIILISMLESAVKGVWIQTAMSLQLLHFIALMYVDDTDILLTALHEYDTIDDVIQRAKKAAKVWQRAVTVSGGAMCPEKCYWTAVDFSWIAGRWSYKQVHEIDGDIRILDDHGNVRTIARYDLNQAREGLGVFVCPDGSWTLQIEELTKKITKWGQRMKSSSLTQKECYISATTAMFKTILHSLPACSFTKNECKQLEVLLYGFLLPKMGISSKFPLVYRYAPHKFQGLALLQIYLHIIIEKLKLFLPNVTKKSQLGLSFQASLETIQLEIGSASQFFRLRFHDFGFLTPISWLATLWEGISWYNIQLMPGTWTLQPPRQHDVSLMDALINDHSFTHDEITSVNRCRLYLRVFFLSDIVSGDGTTILQDAYDGVRSTQWISRWRWPRQSRPPPRDWNLWRIAIRDVWARSETMKIQTPLLAWHHDTHLKFTFRSTVDGAYVRERLPKNKFNYYEKMSYSTRQGHYYSLMDSAPSSDLFPVPVWIVRVNESGIRLVHSTPRDDIMKTSPPTTWDAYYESIDDSIRYILQFSNIHQHHVSLAESIRCGNAIGVTDASVKISKKSSAISWIITDRIQSYKCYGSSGCPRFHAALDSYSSELFGILVILITAKTVCDFYNITSGKLTIACDNDSSLDVAINSSSPVKISDPYFNLIWAARDFRDKISIRFKSKRVKGHQDDYKQRLNFYELLNIEMDKRAKLFRARLEQSPSLHRPWLFGDTQWHVGVSNIHFGYNLEYSIRDHVQGSYLINHLTQKRDLPIGMAGFVDWDAIHRGAQLVTAGEKLWMSKFVSGFCGTASQMCFRDTKKSTESQSEFDQDFKRWKSNMCPLCKIVRENTKHVITCSYRKAQKYRLKQIDEFETWLQHRRTDPKIVTCIIRCLRSNGELSFLTTMRSMSVSEDYLTCANLQDQIGYENFWFGRIATTWRNLQRTYLEQYYSDRRYSADAWVKHLISKLYRVCRNIWRYRCERVHGRDKKRASKREKKALRKEIKLQYQLGSDGVLASHRELLTKTQTQLRKESIRYQKYWVQTLKASRIFFEEAENNMFVGMRDVMRRWAFVPD